MSCCSIPRPTSSTCTSSAWRQGCTVVDSATGAIVGEVGTFPGGTHGIAISTANGRGYTDDGKAGTAQSFDLATLKSVKTIKAEEDADGIAIDPKTGHVFVINGDSGIVTVIDPKTDAAVAKIDGGGKLEFGVAGDKGKIYVNGADKKEIVRIDTLSNKVDAHWPIPMCTSPHGIAIDNAAHRLFSSCVNGVLVVVNTDSGAVVASAPIGKGTDGAAFDSKAEVGLQFKRRRRYALGHSTEGRRYLRARRDDQNRGHRPDDGHRSRYGTAVHCRRRCRSENDLGERAAANRCPGR